MVSILMACLPLVRVTHATATPAATSPTDRAGAAATAVRQSSQLRIDLAAPAVSRTTQVGGHDWHVDIYNATDSRGQLYIFTVTTAGITRYGFAAASDRLPADVLGVWEYRDTATSTGVLLHSGFPVPMRSPSSGTIWCNILLGLTFFVIGEAASCPESMGILCGAAATVAGTTSEDVCSRPAAPPVTLTMSCTGSYQTGKGCNYQGSVAFTASPGQRQRVADVFIYVEWLDTSTGGVAESSFCGESFSDTTIGTGQPITYGGCGGMTLSQLTFGVGLAQAPAGGAYSTSWHDYQPDCGDWTAMADIWFDSDLGNRAYLPEPVYTQLTCYPN